MSHLLILELPGGNDSDILSAALALGHRYTLGTADPGYYRAQPDLVPFLDTASSILTLPSNGALWDAALVAAHHADPFDAVLCLQDLRLVEAARVARALGLAQLAPDAAILCRDKAAVRARIAEAGIARHPFMRVDPGADAGARLRAAVAHIGLPAIIKPVDGFGSQHVFALRTTADLAILDSLADLVAQGPGNYGLGNAAHGALLVERLVEGPLLACDVVRAGEQQVLLGVTAKIMVPAPSFAIRGGCFTTNCGQFSALEGWLRRVLAAVRFDCGITHVELVMADDGPHLIEVNPRLVGARIARLISAARGRSVHADLIDLYLTGTLPTPADAPRHAAARWVLAPEIGVLTGIDWPCCADPAVIEIVPNAKPGDTVRPALDNADRLAMVITAGSDRATIEALADQIAADARVRVRASVSGTG